MLRIIGNADSAVCDLEEPQIGIPETAELTYVRLFIKNEYMHIVKSKCGLNADRWNVAHNER